MNNTPNNSHNIVRDHIQSWLSGQLDADALNHFEAHMSECGSCAAKADLEKELWEMLEQGSALATGPTASSWPGIQQRTFGNSNNGSWFFGGGKMMRGSLAACAVIAGLMAGTLAPGLSTTASADEINSDLWISEASWLDDSATDGLAGIWLESGLSEESGGS